MCLLLRLSLTLLTQGRTYFQSVVPKLIYHVKQLRLDFFLGQIPWPDLGAQTVCRELSRSHPGSDLIWQLYLFMVTSQAASSSTECSSSAGRKRWHGQVPPLHAGAWLISLSWQAPFLCLLFSERRWSAFRCAPVQPLPEGACYRHMHIQ